MNKLKTAGHRDLKNHQGWTAQFACLERLEQIFLCTGSKSSNAMTAVSGMERRRQQCIKH